MVIGESMTKVASFIPSFAVLGGFGHDLVKGYKAWLVIAICSPIPCNISYYKLVNSM